MVAPNRHYRWQPFGRHWQPSSPDAEPTVAVHVRSWYDDGPERGPSVLQPLDALLRIQAASQPGPAVPSGILGGILVFLAAVVAYIIVRSGSTVAMFAMGFVATLAVLGLAFWPGRAAQATGDGQPATGAAATDRRRPAKTNR